MSGQEIWDIFVYLSGDVLLQKLRLGYISISQESIIYLFAIFAYHEKQTFKTVRHGVICIELVLDFESVDKI